MALHKVSIIWVNYNSSKIIQIALESLESIIKLNYPREKHGSIVVDNESKDNFYEKIKIFLEKHSDVKW
jgi:GT2 family glycosyltransferase